MPAVTPAPPVLCLGCAMTNPGQPHRCGRELLPYGGRCECPQPGCG